jgi:ribosomal protein L2
MELFLNRKAKIALLKFDTGTANYILTAQTTLQLDNFFLPKVLTFDN